MGLLALVDDCGRPVAFIMGNYRIEVWAHMESASMEELDGVLSAADFNRRKNAEDVQSGSDESED